MGHHDADQKLNPRGKYAGPLIAGLIMVHLLVGATAAAPDGWRLFRRIHFPAGLPEGPVAVALDAAVIEKCRPDMGDVRVVSGDGSPVPVSVERAPQHRTDEAVPARISRIARRPGSWTEISIDKSGKALSRAVTIQTPAKDFVRKVELRGSDNGRDLYVIRMDGLIASHSKPVPFRDLTIEHPVNNFQYLHLRILDANQPPLRIDGVGCEPPEAEDIFAAPLSVRVVENRTDSSRKATVIIADLGERRFPLRSVGIVTRAKSFVKQYVLSGSSSPGSDTWGKISEGALYRIRHDDAVKEQLTVGLAPQSVRFVLLEISGAHGPPIEVDEITAVGTVSYAMFHYKHGQEYRLLYDNPSADPRPADQSVERLTSHLASVSSEIRLGHAEKYVAPPTEKKRESQRAADRSYGLRDALVPAAVAAGVLLIVGIVLRWRRVRRSGKYRPASIYNVR